MASRAAFIIGLKYPLSSTMASETTQNGAASETTSPVVSFVAFKPQLFVEFPNAKDAVVFYKNALAAEELPFVLSAELKIAGAFFLVADGVNDSAKPVKSGGNCVVLCLESENIEAAIAKAVSAGATRVVVGACKA